MASFSDKVKVLIDVDSTGATSSLTRFKDEWKNAQTATDKWKVGTSAATDFVKNNIASFAAAGAASLVAFGTKAVSAFQDVALAAGEFSAKTGIAVEDASRWQEVAGDLGVNVDGVATAMGKLTRQIGSDPEILKKLGDDAVYLKNGSLDVNTTFLNVIQRLKDIKDPAERASLGTQLLGRSWQDMALLIEQGAGPLAESLASVSESKVIDQNELDKAREFRDAMDDFKDKMEDFALAVGEKLVPVLSDVLGYMTDIFGYLDEGWEGFKDIFVSIGEGGVILAQDLGLTNGEFGRFLANIPKMHEAYRDGIDDRKAYSESLITAYEATHGLTEAEIDNEEATWELSDAWKDLLRTLDIEDQFRNARQDLDDLNTKAAEAFGDPSKFDEYKDAQKEVIENFAAILESIGATSSEQNRVRFLVERGDLEGALELLNALNTAAQTGRPVPIPRPFYLEKRAMGGPVDAGTPYLVGEQGPEIFLPRGAGTIVPNHALGGGTTNITINMPAGSDGDDIVSALQRYARNNGELQLPTTTAVRR